MWYTFFGVSRLYEIRLLRLCLGLVFYVSRYTRIFTEN